MPDRRALLQKRTDKKSLVQKEMGLFCKRTDKGSFIQKKMGLFCKRDLLMFA